MTDEIPAHMPPQGVLSPRMAVLATLMTGLLLAAAGMFWLGPLALASAASLAVGGLVGAWLVQRQVQAGVTRLLSATLGQAGQRMAPMPGASSGADPGRPVRLPLSAAASATAGCDASADSTSNGPIR